MRSKIVVGIWCLAGATLFIFSSIAGDVPALLRVAQEPKLIFDYKADSCEPEDIPDYPLRIAAEGPQGVVAYSSHYVSYPYVGKDVTHLKKKCRHRWKSEEDPDPLRSRDRSWLAAFWSTESGKIGALVHHEYQANRHQGRCNFSEYIKCWYNSILLATSNDGGLTFDYSNNNLILRAPENVSGAHGRNIGFFMPSNIISISGKYYSYVYTTGHRGQRAGVCIIRADGGSAENWSILTSRGWVTTKQYSSGSPSVECEVIPDFNTNVYSVFYLGNGVLGAVVASSFASSPERSFNIFVSKDGHKWRLHQLLFREGDLKLGTNCSGGKIEYPSLIIDSDKNNRNGHLFVVADRRCSSIFDRDLFRFDVIID